MATTYHNAIQQLYVAYFNRPADPAGLAFWETVMEGNGGNSAVISAEFAKSGEYTSEYDQLTTSGVVTQVYQNLFGHAPDSAGLAFWVKALNDRAMTVDTMVAEISKGAQGTDKVAFDSKVVVATAFTNALNTEAEIAAYNNEDAQAEAKALLSTIKTAAQATAAIVPATLDAHVAAVVKAGTPFTLESGLAALGAANEAVADYLEAYGKEHKIKGATVDHVEDAVEAAEADLVTLIDNDGFAKASDGVKAALIADQLDTNAKALEKAQETLDAAQKAVNEVKGLGAAIATVTSAQEAIKEASAAYKEAFVDLGIARDTLRIRNDSVQFNENGSVSIEVDGEDVVVAEIEGGALVIADDIDAADFNGLSAYVNAYNTRVSAEADVGAAYDAKMIAELQVALLENPTASTEGKFTFYLTNKTVTKPTVAQIADELSALAAAGDERADDFYGQISLFNVVLSTPKANALAQAEKGSLGVAQDAVDNAVGLADAIALRDSTAKAAEAATTAANEAGDAFGEAAGTFMTDNLGIAVKPDGTATIMVDGVAQAFIVENNDDVLVLDADFNAADYEGVLELLAAANAVRTTEAARLEAVAAAENAAEAFPLGWYSNLVSDLDEARIAAADGDLAALGVEGAQAAVEALTDAIEALEEAQADAAELEALQDAVEAAIADFTANDYNAPSVLGASAFGRAGSDIFVAVEGKDSTVTNFGRSGDDVLYIGEGFKLNASGDLEDGVNTDLEVFFTQKGNNTIVTIETKVYGSESGDHFEITLTGVSADDLSFENGIISL